MFDFFKLFKCCGLKQLTADQKQIIKQVFCAKRQLYMQFRSAVSVYRHQISRCADMLFQAAVPLKSKCTDLQNLLVEIKTALVVTSC